MPPSTIECVVDEVSKGDDARVFEIDMDHVSSSDDEGVCGVMTFHMRREGKDWKLDSMRFEEGKGLR